jgi:hypothetical protein
MSYSYVDQKERVISGLDRTDSMASYGSLRHVVVVAWLLRLLLFASSWGTCVMRSEGAGTMGIAPAHSLRMT